jgi:aspartate aminotransferase
MAVATKAKQLARQGVDVVAFTVGEPDFDTPENIKQAAHRAIQSGFTKYTVPAGMPELREAVAAKLKADNGLDYAPEEVLVSNGGKQVLYTILLTLVQEGDQVLLPAPYWVSYADQAVMCGAEPVAIDCADAPGMKLTPALLDSALTDRAKVLVLNSPCNPSGVVLTADELRPIVEVALAHDLWIISDEIYEKLIYDGLRHASPASFGDRAMARVITANGVSKSYAMTGWRIGYAAGPREVIAAAIKLQSNLSSGPNSIAQKAALEALTGPQDSIAEMREAFDARRRVIVDGLNAIPGVRCPMPQGAFYAFADCRGLLGKSYGGRAVSCSAELCEALIDQVHVAAVPGIAFGTEGYVRFSYATSEEVIRKGLERLAHFAGSAE